MTELNQEEKYYRNKRYQSYLFMAFIAVAIFAIFLLWNGCHQSKNAQLAYNAIKDTLQSVLDDTARIKGENRRLRYEANDLDLHIADLVEDLHITKGALIDKSDIADRLAREVKKAKASKDTSTQLEKCDSLADAVFVQRNQINQMLVVDARKDSLHNLKVKNLEAQRDNFERGYDSCLSAVKFTVTELPKIKPKGTFYGVVTGVVDGGILGVGGGFTYTTAGKMLVGAKAYATNVGPLYTIEFGIPLSLKRR